MNNSFYQKIETIEKVAERIFEGATNHPRKYSEETLISNRDFQSLMKISRSTSYRWRTKKIIGYSKISSKIYFRMKDIANLLVANYTDLKKKQIYTFGDLISFWRTK